MNIEHRTFRAAEIRAPESDGKTFEATVLTYGVVDDYGTIWDEGVFVESLGERMPRLAWHHNWSDVIGRVVDYKDGADGLRIIGELDDFDAVPRAKQAHAQLRSGTIDNFSVGFRRRAGGHYDDEQGVTHFRNATLDEVSLVLSGAVPGTGNVAMRSAMIQVRSGLVVPVDTLVEIARKKAAGELSDEEAAIALDLAAGGAASTGAGGDGATGGGDGDGEPSPAVPDEGVDAVLDSLGLG